MIKLDHGLVHLNHAQVLRKVIKVTFIQGFFVLTPKIVWLFLYEVQFDEFLKLTSDLFSSRTRLISAEEVTLSGILSQTFKTLLIFHGCCVFPSIIPKKKKARACRLKGRVHKLLQINCCTFFFCY